MAVQGEVEDLIGWLQLMIAMGPSVAVEIVVPPDPPAAVAGEASMRSLRSWVVQRLVEEGVTIAPASAQADRVITLSDTPDAVVVESAGQRYAIEHGPVAVMRLEILHRARLAVEEAGPNAQPQDEPGRVVGLRSHGDAPLGFEGTLESQLLSAGYVITRDPRPSDTVLCVHHGSQRLAASVTSAGEVCGAGVLAIAYSDLDTAESTGELVALVEGRFVPEAPPAPAQKIAAPAAAPKTESKRKRKRKRWSRDDGEVRVGAELGAAVRGGVDASVRGFSRLGLAPGPGGMLQVSVIPSRAEGVRVVDTILAAGPDIHLGRKKFGFDVGVVGGARIHAYEVDVDSGGRVDWYAGLPAGISLGRPRGIRVHLFTETSITGSAQEHRVDNDVRWRRTAWGFRVGIGLSYGWRIL